MGGPLKRVLPALQLTRIALVFTAISNIWMVLLLSEGLWRDGIGPEPVAALQALPLWALLLCTAAVGTGMYVFGMALNDIMDARHDRNFAPQRPLPSGRIGFGAAVAIALGALLLAIAGSLPLGTFGTLLCLVCAALVLFYDGLGKHLPAVGILTLGLVRASHMLVANPALGYLWPVWLTLTHVVAVSAIAHRLEGKRPSLTGRSLWGILAGWAFISVALLMWMQQRGALAQPDLAGLWIAPAVTLTAFLAVGIHTVRSAPSPREGGGLLIKRGLIWLVLYDAAWLAGGGWWWQAALVGLLLPAALGTMALLRHLQALSEPLRFERERG